MARNQSRHREPNPESVVRCWGVPSDASSADSPTASAEALSLDIAAYPLAVPLMASISGLIAIVSLVAQMGHALGGLLYLSGLIAVIMALNYICLRSCLIIVKAVGPVTLKVIGTIMGVILVALAVELVVMGLVGFGVMPESR